MPAWLDYQKLAASVYSALEKNAVVTHDDKILGKKSNAIRQIDVSVKLSLAGHDLLIIVQAKDMKRPADLNVVGEFLSVVEDVQASKGVLICSAGFTEKAIEYAAHCGIDLCSVHDASNPKWALNLCLPVLWIEYSIGLSYEFVFVPDKPMPAELSIDMDPRAWPISFDGGKSYEPFGPFIQAKLSSMELSYEVGKTHEVNFPLHASRVLLGGTASCPAESVRVLYSVTKMGWSGKVRLSNVLGLLNRSSATLKAVARFTEKDIPLARDPLWEKVSDVHEFRETHPNLLTIECSLPLFSDLTNLDIAMTEFEGTAQLKE
ncbi:MAG: restriction endonuclease [Burkholderiales bacterium]|nr:MAG: restriction endonuclease [Burkholderiales bacterium]